MFTNIMTLCVLRVVCALLILNSAAAVSVNGTIDDQYGDSVTGALPTYSPESKWTQGMQCPGCYAQPSPKKAFDHTWHDATLHSTDPEVDVNITMNFNGTAVYVYCILDNNVTYTTYTNLSFSIDNVFVGSFSHIPDGSNTYQYNALVYANTSIAQDEHTFVIHLPRGTIDSFVLFDYVQYTYDSSHPPSPSSPSASSAPPAHSHKTTSLAVGIVVGAVVLALAVSGAIVFIYRRRRTRAKDELPETHPISVWPPETSTAFQHEANQDVPPDMTPTRQVRNVSDPQPTYFVVSNPNVSSENQDRLADREQRLATLQNRSSVDGTSMTHSAVQSLVEDLRTEVERLREMVASMNDAPSSPGSGQQMPAAEQAGRPRTETGHLAE